MPKGKRKLNKIIETYDHLLPPRSDVYAHSAVLSEQYVRVSGIRYLMRRLNCGAAELVRYDYDAHKWVVLAFKGIENAVEKAS